jgi:GNAT superfamily N-acetyltransferase
LTAATHGKRLSPSASHPANFDLRAANEADLPLLVRHRAAIWQEIRGAAAGAVADAAYERWLRARFVRGTARSWIVTADDAAVASGTVVLIEHRSHPRNLAGVVPYLMAVYTEPRYRGQGAATQIIRTAVDWATAEGYPWLSLHATEPARRLYQHLGFKRTWEMRLDLPGAKQV